MTKLFLGLALGSMVLVTGCAASLDKASYATDPVQVETDQGVVTCQLYRHNQVLWDEAIAKPASMTIEEADAVCLNEGYRRLDA